MNKPALLTLGAILSGWLFMGAPGLDRVKLPDLTPSSPTAPTVAPPSTELQGKVAPVTAVLKGHGDKAKLLAGFFADFAVVVEKNPSVVSTAGRLRSHVAKASEMYSPFVGEPGSLPGVSGAINEALKAMLGDDDVAISPAQAKAALEAMAWACGEAK